MNQENLQDTNIIPFKCSLYKNYKLSSMQANDIVLTPNTQPEIFFELPANTYNLYDASVSFSILIKNVKKNNGDAMTNTDLYMFKNDAFYFFNRVQVYQSVGAYLINMDNVHSYSKLVSRTDLKNSGRRSYLDWNNVISNRTGIGSGTVVFNEWFNNPVDTALDKSNQYNGFDNSTTSTYVNGSILSPSYSYNNNVTDNDVNVNGTIYCNVKLRDIIPNSIFSIDKNITLTESLKIVIRFNPTLNIGGYLSNYEDWTTSNDYFGSVTLSNFTMNFNEETNMYLINDASSKNFSFVLPYIYSNQEILPASSSQQTFYNITSTAESSLYKIYYGLFNTQTQYKSVDASSNYENRFLLLDSINNDNFSQYVNNANPRSLCNAKWTGVTMRINGNIFRQYDIYNQDPFRYLCNEFPYNSFSTFDDYLNNCVFAVVLNSEPNQMKYDPDKIVGLPFKSNDLNLQFQWATLNTIDLNHVSFYVVLKKAHCIDGVFHVEW